MWEVPESIPASSEDRGGFPLQKAPVKRPSGVSGTFPHSPNLSCVTDNIIRFPRGKQKPVQSDSKIVRTSTVSAALAGQEFSIISAKVPTLSKARLYHTKRRTNQGFMKGNMTRHKTSGNETNHNLPHVHIKCFQLMTGKIRNSTPKTKQGKDNVSPLNYVNFFRFGNNFRWKDDSNGIHHIWEKDVLEDTDRAEVDNTDTIEDQFDITSPQGQGSAQIFKGNFSRSTQGYKLSKILGKRLYFNRKNSLPESKVDMGKPRGHSRIRRGFHFDYENQEVSDTPRTESDTADETVILEASPFVKAGMPFSINPFLDSKILNKLAKLKLRTISKRLLDLYVGSDVSRRKMFEKHQFEIRGINSFQPLLRRIHHKPSGSLSLIRNLPTYDQNQEAKNQIHTKFDFRVLPLIHKHLDIHDFNFLNSETLPEKNPDEITKRNFDAIGEGVLSGMKQNHVGKRYASLFSTGSNLRRNNDIYLAAYFKPEIASKTTLDSIKNDIDNSQSGFSTQGGNNDYLYGSGTDSAMNSYFKIAKQSKDQTGDFDSVKKLTIKAIRQHFKDNSEIDYLNDITTGDAGVHYQEKRLDAISNGVLGGIRQNFLDKKHTQSHSKELLPGLFKDHLSNKYSHETGSEVKGDYLPNVVSKTNFKNFTPPRIRWRLNMNFDDRKMNPRYLSTDSKSKSSFPKKRNNDLIFPSYSNVIRQKYIEPEETFDESIFDSVPNSVLNSLGTHNFQMKTSNLNKVISRLNELYLSLLTKRKFSFGKNNFVNSFKSVKMYPSAGFKSGDQLKFASKEGSDTHEEVTSNIFGGGDDDNEDQDDENNDVADNVGYGKTSLDTKRGVDFFNGLNQSITSYPGDNTATFYPTYGKVEPDANLPLVQSPQVNGHLHKDTNIPNLSQDFIEKRSFDAIASLSQISGLAQNFIETKTAQNRRIGSIPWSRFQKRNLDMFSPKINDDEGTFDNYKQYIDTY